MTEEKPIVQKPRSTGWVKKDASSRSRTAGEARPKFIPYRRVCYFCVYKDKTIDYKNIALLKGYLSERGKIEPRRRSGNCAKHQRAMALAIKRGRLIGLLPYTSEHIRKAGVTGLGVRQIVKEVRPKNQTASQA